MDDSEENLKALKAFAQTEKKELTENLKSIISHIAKTGKYRIPWDLLKPLYVHTLEVVLNDFIETLPPKTADGVDHTGVEELKKLSVSLVQSLSTFKSAPFTIQRISELLVSPRRHYKNTVKYFRGLEKNVLVISTTEPEPAEEKPAKRPKLDDAFGAFGTKPTGTVFFTDTSMSSLNSVESVVATAESNTVADIDPNDKPMFEDDLKNGEIGSRMSENSNVSVDGNASMAENVKEPIVNKPESIVSENGQEANTKDEPMEDFPD